jgi:hypothetical protein
MHLDHESVLERTHVAPSLTDSSFRSLGRSCPYRALSPLQKTARLRFHMVRLLPTPAVSSLISYFIGGYTRGPEGKSPDEVANEMAGSVLQYYPTLTTPKSDLQKEFASAISATINAIADGKLQASDLAPASRNVPENAIKYGAAIAAVVAAGAFAL